jgi:hypothetical protein
MRNVKTAKTPRKELLQASDIQVKWSSDVEESGELSGQWRIEKE